jgi:hypothetical protein
METKHTKGKWYIERTSSKDGDFQGRILCKSSEVKDVHNHEKEQIYIIVGECMRRNGSSNIHHESNAKLIAAAPDLLEALNDCVNYLEKVADNFNGCTVEIDDLIPLSKEAIKKATE